MKHRGERLEYDTLFGILESVAFRHVLVVTIQGLYSNIIFEGLVEVLHALHVQLNVWKLN